MGNLFTNLVGRAKAITLPQLPDLNPIASSSKGNLKDMLLSFLNLFIWFAGLLAVVYLIYGGVLYITASGDAEKATKGRTALINAIIGIIIILLALVIIGYVRKAIE